MLATINIIISSFPSDRQSSKTSLLFVRAGSPTEMINILVLHAAGVEKTSPYRSLGAAPRVDCYPDVIA